MQILNFLQSMHLKENVIKNSIEATFILWGILVNLGPLTLNISVKLMTAVLLVVFVPITVL